MKYEIDVRVRSSGAFEPMALNGALRPRDVARDSIPWRQVENFESSGPLDPHFIVRENASRQITIGFGDDARGRRLPTGAENVIANYRTGAGSAGNFGAGRLTLLKNRPMAVKSVANPIPASGGGDGDALSNIRAVGPIQARALDRIVSWRDFESFARATPGIEKARVDQLTLAGGTVLHFSLARTEDAQIPPGARVAPEFDFEELSRKLRAAMPRNWTLRLSHYRPVWFNVTARVALDAGAEPKATIAAIEAALADQFGFARRDLARSARRADLIARIQDTPGVQGAFLDSFCLTSSRPGAPAELDARAARVEDGDILPAELLLINPNPVDPRIPARGGLNVSMAT